MKYELAKRLKDAGFPQGHTPLDLDTTNYIFVPTLEELIAAVIGSKPNSFYLEYNNEWSVYENENPAGRWYARYYVDTPVGFYDARGKTQTEAVAFLWLALQ